MVPKTVMTFAKGSSVSSSSIEGNEMLAPKLPEENHSLIHDRPGNRVSMTKDDRVLSL
ncbi:AIF_collapsed_G0031890.mRNA.1.CDS.1 [Saccharomyces cerevisiae]|nr:AIF_collapsed_G0031890.mRNA.1.CDS.1 [Saccharomyces cerevisiae]